MEQSTEKPVLPQISFSQVIKRRRSILKNLTRFMGFKLEGLQIQKDIASELYFALSTSPGYQGQFEAGSPEAQNKLLSALKETLDKRFSGQLLDRDVAMKIAQVVAGNVHNLRLGKPAEPWDSQMADEWVLLLVVGAARRYTPKRKIPGGELKMQIMTGTPSGETIIQFFTDRALLRLAQFIGLRSKWETRRMYPGEFVQMSFIGKLKKGQDRFMSEYYERPALNIRNKRIAKARKLPERACPRGYVVPCYACHVGFAECPLATHRRLLLRARCPRCKEEGFFDPEFTGQKTCLHCQVSIWRSAG